MVRNNGGLSNQKTPKRLQAERRLSFDETLFTMTRDAGCSDAHSSADAVRLVCKFASSLSQTGHTENTEKEEGLDVEVLILDAVESVLAGYSDLVVSPGAEGGGAAFAPLMTSVTLANLRTLAVLLSHRPALSSPVLAALFQLTILVVKHAPLNALDEEGSHVLVSLLELLGCLPRGSEEDGGPSIQHVARITARNVMRRVCPRLFSSDLSFPLRPSETVTGSAAMSSSQVDRDLIPWAERQLVPLCIVSGEEAQAGLREDRRLALSLLDFLCLGDNANSLSSSRRIAIYYLADAVASLLEEKEECGGVDDNDRQIALAFLQRANCVLSSPPAPAVPNIHMCEGYEARPQPPRVPVQDVREFILLKDAEYVTEFTLLHHRIEEERENQDLLQWQLGELTREREKVLHELKEGPPDLFVHDEGGATSCPLTREDLALNVGGGMASPSHMWANNIANSLQSLEELTVALHERQQNQSSSV